MLAFVGLVGIGMVGWAAFSLARDPANRSNTLVIVGVLGLLCSMVLGVVPALLVGTACALIGRGLRPGSRSVMAVVSGVGLLALPFAFGLLMYAASLNA